LRDDRERLADILEAIDRAQRYAVRGQAAFQDDELIQAWMVQQLMVIGEDDLPSLRKAVADLLDEND
jgi:uncharacterized protein with HEPN domain